MDKGLVEEGERGKSLRIYLVNPPLNEPWREHADYIADRHQMDEMFRRAVEAHDLLKKSYRNNVIGLWLTLGIMIGASIAAFVEFDNYLDAMLYTRATSYNAEHHS